MTISPTERARWVKSIGAIGSANLIRWGDDRGLHFNDFLKQYDPTGSKHLAESQKKEKYAAFRDWMKHQMNDQRIVRVSRAAPKRRRPGNRAAPGQNPAADRNARVQPLLEAVGALGAPSRALAPDHTDSSSSARPGRTPMQVLRAPAKITPDTIDQLAIKSLMAIGAGKGYTPTAFRREAGVSGNIQNHQDTYRAWLKSKLFPNVIQGAPRRSKITAAQLGGMSFRRLSQYTANGQADMTVEHFQAHVLGGATAVMGMNQQDQYQQWVHEQIFGKTVRVAPPSNDMDSSRTGRFRD